MPKLTLAQLFRELDQIEGAVPLDTLCRQLRQLDLDNGVLDRHLRFGDDGYRRNLVHLGPGYAALLLCWRPGQASPIHDHRGSACALRVIRGTGSERRYERESDGRLVETGRNAYLAGQVCGTYDADIHTMRNEQTAGDDLVTLHVYTPPMRKYCTYSLENGEVRECADREVLAEEQRRARLAGAALLSTGSAYPAAIDTLGRPSPDDRA